MPRPPMEQYEQPQPVGEYVTIPLRLYDAMARVYYRQGFERPAPIPPSDQAPVSQSPVEFDIGSLSAISDVPASWIPKGRLERKESPNAGKAPT